MFIFSRILNLNVTQQLPMNLVKCGVTFRTLSPYIIQLYCENSYQCSAVNYFRKRFRYRCLTSFKEKVVRKDSIIKLIQRFFPADQSTGFYISWEHQYYMDSNLYRSGVFTVSFEQIPHIILMVPLLSLNKSVLTDQSPN